MRSRGEAARPGKGAYATSILLGYASTSRSQPGECALGGRVMLTWHLGEPFRYDLGVDESCLEQRRHEVLIFFAEGAQLCDAQVLLVETQSGVQRFARGRGGVRVLDFDNRSRQPCGRTAVSKSTPSMLKPCCSSNGDHSLATPSIRSASRVVSSPLLARGRISISTDMVASDGSSSSAKDPRMD
jgi:hypothetical protein